MVLDCLENIIAISGIDIVVVLGNNITQRRFNDQFAWCEETFGQFRDRWNYDIMKDAYAFRHEEDAVLFKLKWS
jgi:hypothetical protein